MFTTQVAAVFYAVNTYRHVRTS